MTTKTSKEKQTPTLKSRRRLTNVQVNEISLVDNPAVPAATFMIAKRDADETDLADELVAEIAAGEEVAEVEKAGEIPAEIAAEFESGPTPDDATPLAEAPAEGVAKEHESGHDESDEDIEDQAEVQSVIVAIRALRVAAGTFGPEGLGLLIGVLEFARRNYPDDLDVRAELNKADDVSAKDRLLTDIAMFRKDLSDEDLAEVTKSLATVDSESVNATASAAPEVPVTSTAEPVAEPVAKTEPEVIAPPAPAPSIEDQINALWAARQTEKLAKAEDEKKNRVFGMIAKIGEKFEAIAASNREMAAQITKATGKKPAA